MTQGVPVVFDTNALLLPFTDGTDLDGELERLVGAVEWVVPQSIHWELERLSKGKAAASRHAKTALALVARRARVEPTTLSGDDGLLQAARRLKGVVVSNDRKVQSEAAKSGLKVLVAREKGLLSWLGHP